MRRTWIPLLAVGVLCAALLSAWIAGKSIANPVLEEEETTEAVREEQTADGPPVLPCRNLTGRHVRIPEDLSLPRPLAENKDLSITVTDLETTDAGALHLRLQIRNRTEKPLLVHGCRCIVNGFHAGGVLHAELDPREEGEAGLFIPASDLALCRIRDLYDLKGSVYYGVGKDASAAEALEFAFPMQPGADKDPWANTGALLLERDGVTLRLPGWTRNTFGEDVLLVYLRNDTDRNLCVLVRGDPLVNGDEAEISLWNSAPAHSVGVDTTQCRSRAGIPISRIQSMHLALEILDTDTFEILETLNNVAVRFAHPGEDG